jgi:hypothetical protein
MLGKSEENLGFQKFAENLFSVAEQYSQPEACTIKLYMTLIHTAQ